AGLDAHDPGGIDVLAADLAAFRGALTRESHTLKRALTDPRLFSGIGNAYSDEILHAPRRSPPKLTTQLSEQEIGRLHHATRDTLVAWIERLRAATGDDFPEGVTAFREGMAVHGRYRKPCPVCGSPVQRIRYAENEVNYCATCQTGGRVLADRALSRLLQEDWPRSLAAWEARLPGAERGLPRAAATRPASICWVTSTMSASSTTAAPTSGPSCSRPLCSEPLVGPVKSGFTTTSHASPASSDMARSDSWPSTTTTGESPAA